MSRVFLSILILTGMVQGSAAAERVRYIKVDLTKRLEGGSYNMYAACANESAHCDGLEFILAKWAIVGVDVISLDPESAGSAHICGLVSKETKGARTILKVRAFDLDTDESGCDVKLHLRRGDVLKTLEFNIHMVGT